MQVCRSQEKSQSAFESYPDLETSPGQGKKDNVGLTAFRSPVEKLVKENKTETYVEGLRS